MARQVSLRGKRFSVFEKPELVAHHVHQVRRVAAVEHAEAGVEPDRCGVPADQPIGDRVKRSRPGQPHVADDAWCAARHLERGPARKGEQQDAFRRGALKRGARRGARGCWSCRCQRRQSPTTVRNRTQPLPAAWGSGAGSGTGLQHVPTIGDNTAKVPASEPNFGGKVGLRAGAIHRIVLFSTASFLEVSGWLKSLSGRTTKRQTSAPKSPAARDIQKISARQACCLPGCC